MASVRHVLVSGAGIAGPALAYWLHHHGISATVVERAPAVRAGGYAIDVRGVALDVAERMGVLDNIRGAATGTTSVGFVDRRGRVRVRLPTTALAPDGRSDELQRGDLIRLLVDRTTDRTEYVFGDRVTGLDQGPDGVLATFEHAAPRTFDLVVCADGLHSSTRALALGPEEPLRRFLHAYISIFSVPDDMGLSAEALLFNTPGRLAGLTHSPRVPGAKAILALTRRPDSGIDRAGEDEQRRALRAAFTGQGWITDRLLDAMDDAPDFYFDSVTQIRMDRWSAGRVTTLGDAAYAPSPMSGQGTSLAMVGAYVLAQELGRRDDHTGALAAYETRMRPFVRANQDIAGSGMAFLVPRTRLGIAARDALVRATPVLSRLGSLESRIARAAEALDLDARAPV
ncbi:FAD-dependent monooxygenase [Nocardiopsis aegyptia]|uniref:FAD-dependent monooxygenase n=1 Tax=Nocardiopsis aegyptia TaxID=220378 RepID=UPI00366CF1F0